MECLAELIGESAAIRALREQIRQLVAHQGRSGRLPPILLQGETGTGKGLLARLIHRAGPRAGAPFVDVNCAAIPETLLEAELFGFEKGAFTDARQAKRGLFQAAHGGTLFLDEVSLLPEALQAKLLTALEERAIRPLGATRRVLVDIAIVAATNTVLSDGVRERRFREDLFHRLAVLTLTLPPLRERPEDILLLADRFLRRECADYGLPPRTLSADAQSALVAYAWPGNVRELSNVIERAALLSGSHVITAETLGLPLGPPASAAGPEPGEAGQPLDERIARIERHHVLDALREAEGNVSRAARRLGVPRHWLRYRVERDRLFEPRHRASPGALRHPGATSPTAASVPAGIARSFDAHWERRHVAFVRVDVVRSPGDSAPEVAKLLAVVSERIESFGGLVQEVGPSTVSAVFGLEPVENAPVVAGLAAVAVLKAFERLRRSQASGPATVVALDVAAVMVGRVNGIPQVNAKDRHGVWRRLDALLARTDPDTITVGQAAVPFLDRRFDLGANGPGIAGEPGRRLMLHRSGAFGLGARHLSPFVGRTPELAMLAERWDQVERGAGQVVCVVGEPGVGKSRFVYELTRAKEIRNWCVLHGSAVSTAGATPWFAIRELLKRHLGIDDSDTPPDVHEKVVVAMQARSLDADAQPLLALLDVPVDDPGWHRLDPSQRRQRTFESLLRLLTWECEQHPLLVLIEDFHWSDSDTRGFLDALVERLPTAAILLVTTCRPGFRHTWSSRTYYTQLRLDGLSPANAGELLHALLGDDSTLADLKRVLIARTDGNPLFLEESVRELVETGALSGRPGAHTLAIPLSTLDVPATVQAILAVRVDRLPGEDRRLLQTAAVIGRDVPVALLEAVAELEPADLRAGLGRLRAAEFLYESSRPLELEYTFKHALTQEVACQSVPEDRRRAVHRRVMEAIERQYAGRLTEQAERLGHHALAGEAWDKAVGYLRQAGAKAFDRGSDREALAWFARALDALAHLPERRESFELSIDLRFDLRHVLTRLGEFNGVFDRLREAASLAERMGDRYRLAWASLYLGNYFHYRGEHVQTVEAATRALDLATFLGDDRLEITSHLYLGSAHWALGNLHQASELLRLGAHATGGALARERFGLASFASVLFRETLALCLPELDHFEEAIAIGLEAVQLARELSEPWGESMSVAAVGNAYLLKGEFDLALRELERAFTICRAAGLRYPSLVVAGLLARAYVHSGRSAEAITLLEEALTIAAATQLLLSQPTLSRALGEAYLAMGRPGDALASATRALDLARAQKARAVEAWTLHLLGEIHSSSDPPEGAPARAAYYDSMALAEERGMRPLVGRCHLGLGILYRRADGAVMGLEHLTTALAMFREMGMPFWAHKAQSELACLGSPPPTRPATITTAIIPGEAAAPHTGPA
jgi:DNA-binding NtrC family response regulator/tetratricopeptide (TPR) repeat protein